MIRYDLTIHYTSKHHWQRRKMVLLVYRDVKFIRQHSLGLCLGRKQAPFISTASQDTWVMRKTCRIPIATEDSWVIYIFICLFMCLCVCVFVYLRQS